MPTVNIFKRKWLLIVILLIVLIVLVVVAGLMLGRKPSQNEPISSAASTSPPNSTSETSTPATKVYRNEEFGFEFQYPKDWTFEINNFYSPASKFNLQGNASAEDYNAILPPFLINIVTPDFVDRQFSDISSTASKIFIGGITGLKYEYEEHHGSYKVSNLNIILPLGQYKMIIGADKEHIDMDAVNQILVSFKFLK